MCIVGIGGRDEAVSFSALELFHFARTVVGCVGGSVDVASELPVLCDWIEAGELDLAPLVSGHASLDQLEQAFTDLEAGRAIRTVLQPQAGASA